MIRRPLLALIAVLVIVVGAWMQFGPSSDAGNPSASQTATEPIPASATQTTTTATVQATFRSEQPDAIVIPGIGSIPATTVQKPTTVTTAGLQQSLPGSTIDHLADAGPCTPVEAGFGIAMKEWGDVRLPYANGWPTNQPGDVPDCSPATDFGGAVVVVHLLYIDSLKPGFIHRIGVDTPARQHRIDNHPGPVPADALPYVCKPDGWRKGVLSTRWIIFHHCGDHPTVAHEVDLVRRGDDWLIIYHVSGEPGFFRDVEPGETYYPFEAGD